MKKKICAEVLSQMMLADGIYDLRFRTGIAKNACPGQFVGVYPSDGSMLLPRPISICSADADKEELRLVYRVAGKGTLEFSSLKRGDRAYLLGPLGNGYPLDEAAGRTAVLIGGGIGVPPLLQTAITLNSLADENRPERIVIIMGYRNEQTFLADEFRKQGELIIATDDGSTGVHGTVIDAMKQYGITDGVIYACGPMPMLKGIKAYAAEAGMKAWISLEERMACGVGACLGCVVKTRHEDAHSHVNNARLCTDGPVFDAEEVDI
jgi:dihydroorotate dehydrogenase electron transfer subunit